MIIDPFSPKDYPARKLHSPRDVLLLGLDTASLRMHEAFTDLTEAEYNWEPLSETERLHDLRLPADKKRVWRVFQTRQGFVYDYAGGTLNPPPFTTIAWLMNHIAVTAQMYLSCIKTGKPAGEDLRWDDLPVHSTLATMCDYTFHVVEETKAHLRLLQETEVYDELNRFTPAPWGEMRPTFLNLWGGIIEHALQHTAQITVRKEQIRATS
jgi:DinB superfamily